MYKFAHLADCHLGAWRDRQLRALNLEAFEQAMDKCVAWHVDFIIISGDLFHSNIPDLSTVKRAVESMKNVRQEGIRIYVVYGSHDYSPNAVSMIDILASADLFKKVVEVEAVQDRLILKPFRDDETQAVIAGLSGRSGELEKSYFELLDVTDVEKESGFKIFVFHSAVTELKPSDMPYLQGIPMSRLPRGFNYYAGGHIHGKIEAVEGGNTIIFPGPLFGATFTDLEDTAKGEKRGFYVVEFEDSVEKLHFIETPVNEIIYDEIEADKKTARQVDIELKTLVEEIDACGKIVLLRIKGALSSGKVADIDFTQVRDLLLEKDASYVFLNRRALTTEEATPVTATGESSTEIENRLLKNYIGSFKVDPTLPKEVQKVVAEHLTGYEGLNLARNLLLVLRQEQLENERKNEYRQRILKRANDQLPGRPTE